ncbi:hypothetical protein QBC37DRAFT_317252 [Rhypophila decipiens]|uniref:Uncharacterized protein n=1 Tax=Rhypophila decipiens TaxID=261697 RepID=A0AAN6Y649_9PEZI|nr:hypothetical protein QBC37DRAFT_317252 [Rhypophila decipiens]
MAPPYLISVHEIPPTPNSTKPSQIYEYGKYDPDDTHSSSTGAASNGYHNLNRNALVFIGGLGDGLYTVPYIRHIVRNLNYARTSSPETSQARIRLRPWTVFEVRLSSAFSGWGNSSLSQDVDEIAAAVRYLRSTLNKRSVVLMGHSTGCQDCVAYLRRWSRNVHDNRDEPTRPADIPEVDGVILQGPVSDREFIAMTMGLEEMERSRDVAWRMIEGDRAKEYMPRDRLPADMRDTPVTAYRFHSLTCRGGDDDFFSSDLTDGETENIWNPLTKPVLIVPSEKDEFVPETVNVQDLMDRWRGSCRPGVYSDLSGLIPNANHRVDDGDARMWLVDRVLKFLAQLEEDDQ